MSTKNKSANKRKKVIAGELNRLLKSDNQLNKYTISYKTGNLFVSKDGCNPVQYTDRLMQIGNLYAVQSHGEIELYRQMEANYHHLEQLVGLYDQLIANANRAYAPIVATINNLIAEGTYKTLDLKRSQLTIDGKIYKFVEDRGKIINHVEKDQLYEAIFLLINTVKAQCHFNLEPHLKSGITPEYREGVRSVMEKEPSYHEVVEKINTYRSLLTPEVIGFIHLFQSMLKKSIVLFDNLPTDLGITLHQSNRYLLTFKIGTLYQASFYSLKSEPFYPTIVVDKKAADKLDNTIAFIQSLPSEYLTFSEQYLHLRENHNQKLLAVMTKKNVVEYGKTLISQNRLPALVLKLAKTTSLEYQYNEEKTVIDIVNQPEAIKKWLSKYENDFENVRRSIEKQIDDFLSEIDTRLTDPNNRAILSLINDHEKKGLTILVNVLRGSKSAPIYANDYDKHPSYGTLKAYKKEAVEEMITNLVTEGLIHKQIYTNRYYDEYAGFALVKKTRLQMEAAKEMPIAVSLTLPEVIQNLKNIKQITTAQLVEPLRGELSSDEIQQVMAFFRTAKCVADAEEALVAYFVESIPPKYGPLFAMNGQMETGKVAKRFKKAAEILSGKEDCAC